MRAFYRISFALTALIAISFSQVGESFADEFESLVSDLRGLDRRASAAAFEKISRMRYEDERVVEALMDFVSAREEDWRLKVRGIRILGEMADPRSTEVLITLLNDPFVNENCPAMQWHTALALGNFRRAPKVVSALIDSLSSRDILLREAIIQSLGNIGDPQAVEFIVPALSDSSFAIRISAVKALGQIGDRSAAPFLEAIANGDKEPSIREEARAALKAIKSRRPTRQFIIRG